MTSVSQEGPDSPLGPAFLTTVSRGPGVYLMSDAGREVIYVGKARDLRKRLASYVRFKGEAHSKTGVMLARVARVETILTGTEKEALILEASLIKKHRPRYNVILRDDKNYPLIMVSTSEAWPRVVVTRRRRRDGNRYFGPYASGTAMRATLGLLHSAFPLRRCKGALKPRSRPCLDRQIGRCLGPCVDQGLREPYLALVDQVIMVLEGRNRDLAARLEAEMREAAEILDFERAALLRDQVRALGQTLERQVVVSTHFHDQDVFGFHRCDASVALTILFVRGGVISGSQNFFLPDPLGDDAVVLAAAINQYYSSDRPPPLDLLLPFLPEDALLLGERLADLREGPVHLLAPQRGDRVRLMAMAADNAAQVFTDRERKEESWDLLARALTRDLRLVRRPERIECLDISNLGGEQMVGSLVCFREGEKSAADYRHYRLPSGEGPDDYAAMRTVLLRRFGGERPPPDLLLIDGGKGQLNVAHGVLGELGLMGGPALAAIAKEHEDEGEKVFLPGRKNPLGLARHSPVLLFLMRVRDEAHRFGITFHRRLRGRDSLRSRLDRLEGVGPARRRLLLRHFGSLKRIRAASEAELAEVEGIGPALAASIAAQLRGEG